MSLNSFDLNLRLNEVLVKKALDEFDSKKVSIEEMKTFIRYRNFNLGQDAQLVSDVFNAYQDRIGNEE